MSSKLKKVLVTALYLLIHIVVFGACGQFTWIWYWEMNRPVIYKILFAILIEAIVIGDYFVAKTLIDRGYLGNVSVAITLIWNVITIIFDFFVTAVLVGMDILAVTTGGLIWADLLYDSLPLYLLSRIIFIQLIIGRFRLLNKLRYNADVTGWMKVQAVLSLLPVVNIFNFFVNLIWYRKDRVMCKKLLIAAGVVGSVILLAGAVISLSEYLLWQRRDIASVLAISSPYGIPLLIDLQLLKTQYMHLYKPKTGDSLREP